MTQSEENLFVAIFKSSIFTSPFMTILISFKVPEAPKKVVPEDKIYVTIPKMRETPATKGIFKQHQTLMNIFDFKTQKLHVISFTAFMSS